MCAFVNERIRYKEKLCTNTKRQCYGRVDHSLYDELFDRKCKKPSPFPLGFGFFSFCESISLFFEAKVIASLSFPRWTPISGPRELC